MNNGNAPNLAIIIPAYKPEFLTETLDSIVNQTCRDFVLYVGDDASPYRIEDIILSYQTKLPIVYQRFEHNLGLNNLVAHWDRCVQMTKDEFWIWLFSDDDLMEPTCVEYFYHYIRLHPEEVLLHFNVRLINADSIEIRKPKYFPKTISVSNFFQKKIKWKIDSFVIEYIFNKAAFYKNGRFEIFDLGWCSDDATWMKLSRIRDIPTIDDATVKWRLSQINISSITNNKEIILRKLKANCEFIKWTTSFFAKNGIVDKTNKFEKAKWAFIGIFATSSLTFYEKYNLIEQYLEILGYHRIAFRLKLYLFYFQLKTYSKFKVFT